MARNRKSNSQKCDSSEEEFVQPCENFGIEWKHDGSSSWIIDQPQFKFCKKRKEFFSNEYEQIWYKSPYKYNMRMKVTSAVALLSDTLSAKLNVTHEDGSVVKSKTETITFSAPTSPKRKSSSNAKARNDSSAESDSDNEESSLVQNKQKTPTCHHEIKLGPFQFNVCSYKYDGKKFRLNIHLHHDGKEVCCLTSPAFLIKAKKPIAKPGIKSKKRTHDEMQTSCSTSSKKSEPRAKQAKVEQLPPQMAPLSHPQIAMLNPFAQLTPDSLDMQKKLVEEQLYQFGCMINSLLTGARSQTAATASGGAFVPPQTAQQNVMQANDDLLREFEAVSQVMHPQQHFYSPVAVNLQHQHQAMLQQVPTMVDSNEQRLFDESYAVDDTVAMLTDYAMLDSHPLEQNSFMECPIDTSDLKLEDFGLTDFGQPSLSSTDGLFFL